MSTFGNNNSQEKELELVSEYGDTAEPSAINYKASKFPY